MVRNNVANLDIAEYAGKNEAEVDMSLNENPLGPSPEVMKAIRNISVEEVSRYQHPDEGLLMALGEFLNIDDHKLILTNGCDGAIEMISKTFFGQECSVAIPVPSFHRYRTHARLSNAEIQLIYPDDGLRPSTSKLKDLEADYLILGNPHNPSGERFEINQLRELNNSINAHIIVDEALAHFNQSHSELVSEGITVIGSFSKLFGIAGLRAGYIASNQKESIAKTGSPFKINSVAQSAIRAVLKDEEYLQNSRRTVEKELDRLKTGLDDIGVEYSDSESLTMLLDFENTSFEGKASSVAKALLKNGVNVVEGRNFEGLNDNFLRISVRGQETNQHFLEQLENIIKSDKIKVQEAEN